MNQAEFENAVCNILTDIIDAFHFKVRSDEKLMMVELSSSDCIIEIFCEGRYIQSIFVDPKVKLKRTLLEGYPKYHCWSVWKFLYPNDNGDFSFEGMDISEQLSMHQK